MMIVNWHGCVQKIYTCRMFLVNRTVYSIISGISKQKFADLKKSHICLWHCHSYGKIYKQR